MSEENTPSQSEDSPAKEVESNVLLADNSCKGCDGTGVESYYDHGFSEHGEQAMEPIMCETCDGVGSDIARCSANLILDQGMIRMKNNAPSGDYMRKWQMKHGISDGTPIRIMTAEQYEELNMMSGMAGIA